jgi:carboxypeptidase family protein
MIPLLNLILLFSALQGGPTATLIGRVTDVIGATMGDVEVQAINVETGLRFLAHTNEEGLYNIRNLSPGIYRLILQKHGFRSVIKPGVELRVQDIFALNFEMRIGSEAESVTEDEGAPLLQAETATVGQTIDRRMVAELPTLTRNPHDFVGLSAGAVAVPNRTGGGVGFAINGQRSESANFLLDGSDSNTNPATTKPGQIIPYDAVREYRVLTNSVTAEYGRNAGFVSNLVTRSGSNELHGSLYDFVRNSALAANSFENNAYGRRKPTFNRHETGGSLGGPIVTDKIFFFGAAESILVRSWGSTTFRVPTPELVAISSPATKAIFNKYPLPADLRRGGSVSAVTPFGGGPPVTVPLVATVSRRSPVDTGAGPPQNTIVGLARIDYAVSPQTMLTARYALQHGNEFAPATQAYSPQLDQPVLTRNHHGTLNLTRTWSGSVLTESRLSFSRLSMVRPQTGSDAYLQQGWTTDLSLPALVPRTGGPRNSYQLHQLVSWVRRNHDLKFGGQIINYRESIIDKQRFPNVAFFPLGNFVIGSEDPFTQSFVNGSYPIVGLWFDFVTQPSLVDQFEGHVNTPNPSWHLRYTDAAWFVQDTWKVSRRLTLTPGLRWEYFGVQHSVGQKTNRDVNFYLGLGDSYYERFANGKFLRTMDALGDYRNHFIRPDRNNFGPRLGLALDLTGNGTTILRAGGGIFFDSALGRVPPTVLARAVFSNVPFTQDAVVTGGSFEFFPALNRTLPFVERVDPDLRTAYASAWNATIEHELGGNVVVSGSYIGSAGSNLELSVLENGIGSGRYLGRPSERILNDFEYFLTVKGLAHSSYHSLQLKAESRQIRPLGLQVGANYTWGHSIDNASDRGLPLERDRFGLGVLLDPTNLRLDRGNSSFDQTHRLVTHLIWEIPEVHTRSGLLKYVTSGWELSGILSFQTGLPFALRDGGPEDDEFGFTRPRVTGVLPHVLKPNEMIRDPKLPNRFVYLQTNDSRDINTWRCIPNAAPFGCIDSIYDPPDNLLPRNYYRRPGSHFEDFAFAKKVPVRENVQLQFRAEFYNLFNHANLELPADAYSVTRGVRGPFTVFANVEARYGGPPRQVVIAAKIIF